MVDDRITLAARHVSEGQRIVAAQKDLIERLKVGGRDIAEAQRLLHAFEHSLAIFEDDLRRLEAS
jgi:hypothetical protein